MTLIPSEIVTREEREAGLSRLHALSQEAAKKLKEGALDITEGILALNTIREERLHAFAEMDFETFLSSWLDHNGFTRSWIFSMLEPVRKWSGGLRLEAESILEYAEGIYTVKPILSGDDSPVGEYDQRTGEIKSLRNGWAEILPDGNTHGERIRKYIEQKLKPEDTRRTARKMLRDDNPSKDQYMFSVSKDNGVPQALGWSVDYADESHKDGVGLSTMPPDVYSRMCNLLKISREWR